MTYNIIVYKLFEQLTFDDEKLNQTHLKIVLRVFYEFIISTFNNSMIIPKCFRISRMFDMDAICRVIGIGISSITFPRETLSLYNIYTKLYIIYFSVIKLKYSTLLIWLFSYSSLSNNV